MSQLEGTNRQAAGHRRPRLSLMQFGLDRGEASAQRTGQEARAPSFSGRPGWAAGGARAPEAGTRARRAARKARLQGGRGAGAVRKGGQHPPPGLRKEPGPLELLRSPIYPWREVADGKLGCGAPEEQRRGCAS